MIISLAIHNSSEKMKLLLIDPQGRGYRDFNCLPHLLFPVSIKVREGLNHIKWANELMEERIKNRLKNPLLIIFIEDLFLLLKSGGKNLENQLLQLILHGGNAGIYVIVCTRKPLMYFCKNLTAKLFPTRVVGKVALPEEALAASDVVGSGAEKLMGRGDFLVFFKEEVIRLQGAHISKSEIQQSVRLLAETPIAMELILSKGLLDVNSAKGKNIKEIPQFGMSLRRDTNESDYERLGYKVKKYKKHESIKVNSVTLLKDIGRALTLSARLKKSVDLAASTTDSVEPENLLPIFPMLKKLSREFPPDTILLGASPFYANRLIVLRFGSLKTAHILIAGGNNNSRGNLIASIIANLALNTSTQSFRFILIGLENGINYHFNGLPHLKYPIMEDPLYNLQRLKWVVQYIEKCQKERNNLLTLVIFINNLTKLVTYNRNEVEYCIKLILEQGYKVGVHLVACAGEDLAPLESVADYHWPVKIVGKIEKLAEIRMVTTQGVRLIQKIPSSNFFYVFECNKITPLKSLQIDADEIKHIVFHLGGNL